MVTSIRSIVTLLMIVELLNNRQIMIFPFVSNKGIRRVTQGRERERGRISLFIKKINKDFVKK